MSSKIHPVALIALVLVAGCGTPAALPPSTFPDVPTPSPSTATAAVATAPASPDGSFRIEVRERFPEPDVDLIEILGLLPNEAVDVTFSIPGQNDVTSRTTADPSGTVSYAHPRDVPLTIVVRRTSGEVAEAQVVRGEAPDGSASGPRQPGDLSVRLEDIADPANVLVVVDGLPTGGTLSIQLLMPRLALLFEGERADASGEFSISVPRSEPGDAALVVVTRESGEIATAAVGSPGPRAPFGVRFEHGAAGSPHGTIVVEGVQPGMRVSLYWEFREGDKEGIGKMGICSDFFGEARYQGKFPLHPIGLRAIGPDGEVASGSSGGEARPLPDDLPPLTPQNLVSGC